MGLMMEFTHYCDQRHTRLGTLTKHFFENEMKHILYPEKHYAVVPNTLFDDVAVWSWLRRRFISVVLLFGIRKQRLEVLGHT